VTTNALLNVSDRKPPYISFKTFLTAIETFEQGIPPTIERSVWHTFSGGLQGHTLNAFKFLGLIDEAGTPQPALKQLVDSKGDERKITLKTLIEDKYSKALELGKQNASFQQLQDHFRNFGVSGGTLEMVVRFFLDACEYTGEKCSPFWAKAKKTMRKSRKITDTGADDGKRQPPPPSQPAQPQKPNVKSVQLQNEAGTVAITLSVDLTKLVREDWDWLQGLINNITTYGQRNKNENVQ